MYELRKYVDNTDRNNVIIQKALREIDSEPLSTAMVGLEADLSQALLRNMSPRSAELLLEDIHDHRGASQEAIDVAREFFSGLLVLAAKHYETLGPAYGAPDVRAPDLSSDDALVASFTALAAAVRRHGVSVLQDLQGPIDDKFLAKGFQLLLDGWDPLQLRSTLERYKQAHLRQVELRLEVYIEALDALGSGDRATVMTERLNALLARF